MHRHKNKAFTIVELLTVIGIITILISILLPVVSRVRTQALITATQAQITQIAGAIERYRLEQSAYPGPMSNVQILLGTAKDSQSTAITQTENMVLGLCGGWEVSSSSNGGAYDETMVGQGPSSHNPNVTRRPRYPAYIDPQPGKLTPAQDFSSGKGSWSSSGRQAGDSSVPEFMDRFQTPRPILYMRANIGAIGISSADNSRQYCVSDSTRYTSRTRTDASLGDFDFGKTNPNSDYSNFDDYLKDPNTQVTSQIPRGKDKFILVSAGPDGIFGTKDDIFYGAQ